MIRKRRERNFNLEKERDKKREIERGGVREREKVK